MLMHQTPKIVLQVDLTNPGEFFACCGLLELADRRNSGAEGWFSDGKFSVAPCDPSEEMSINDLLWSLANVTVEPESNSTTSPLLLADPLPRRLDWWLLPSGEKSALKTWAGHQSSLKMFRKWQEPLKEILHMENPDSDWLFRETCRVQGPYGFDSGVGWNALSVGFSLNEHARYQKLPTRPALEMLGAIGIQRFFPEIVLYSPWSVPLRPSVARLAALGQLPQASMERLEAKFTNRGSYKGLDSATIPTGEIK